MVDAQTEDQNLIFQIYLNKDRSGMSLPLASPFSSLTRQSAASERLLKKVEDLGCKAIMFTVDAHVSGFRTLDVRSKRVVEQVRSPASSKRSLLTLGTAGSAVGKRR